MQKKVYIVSNNNQQRNRHYMKVPDKSILAEYIRVEMAKLGISNSDLADSLGKTTATIVALRNGSASYQLYDKAIKTIDNWRRLEPK